MRERVSYHQYHLLLPVTVFRSQLPMAPRHAQAVVSSTSISAWLAPSATDRFSPTPQLGLPAFCIPSTNLRYLLRHCLS